ncbi:hypothetical protein H8E88_19450 [candidate division KSB1 bacterium]|nr:hypothetical protein [candidate division KSB1 bacterium]
MSLRFEKSFPLTCFILFCSIGISQQNLIAFQPNFSPQTKSPNQTTSQLPLRFEHIGQKQGLEQKEILCIIQDSQGYLWLGTNDGLVRYDGCEFRTYKHQPGDTTTIPGNGIVDLFEDSRDWLWIGTSDGLSLYDHNRDCFLQIPRLSDSYKILQTFIFSINEDASGAIWAGTHFGLIRLIIPEQAEKGNQNIVSALLDNGAAENLIHVLIDENRPIAYNEITTTLIDSRGILWIGTAYNGLKWILPFKNKSALPESDYRVKHLRKI